MSTHTYGEHGGELFEAGRKSGHGRHFLNRALNECLIKANVLDKAVADLGCGPGTVSIDCAKRRASLVYGIDIQPKMIERCEIATGEQASDVRNRLRFECGDVCSLTRVGDARFDVALSINVGCNLTCDELALHLKEMRRILVAGGRAYFAYPDNLNVMFTDGRRDTAAVAGEIRAKLGDVEPTSGDELQRLFQTSDEVLFCTFVEKQGRYHLIDDQNESLAAGTRIFRKIPGLVVPNYWHGHHQYVEFITRAGFRILDLHREKFRSEADRARFNQTAGQYTLGKSFTTHNAFAVIDLAAI